MAAIYPKPRKQSTQALFSVDGDHLNFDVDAPG